MRGKIRYTGRVLQVYSLDQGGSAGDEVFSFLTSTAPESMDQAKAFALLLQHVADNGTASLTGKMRKCWPQDGTQFCEFRKAPWRISYFQNGSKLLLVTVFRKRKKKPVDEYRRAVRLYCKFLERPDWENNNASE